MLVAYPISANLLRNLPPPLNFPVDKVTFLVLMYPMGKIRHDWPAIKAEYVEGGIDEKGNRAWPSMEDVAQKYGVRGPSVRREAAKGGWLQQRASFVTKVEQARKEQKSDELAGKAAEFDIKCLKVAEAGLSHVARHYQLAAEAKKPLPAGELAQLSAAQKNYQQIGRLALGDSTEKVDGAGTMVGNKIEVVFVNSPNGSD